MMKVKICEGCETLQCFFKPIHPEAYPEIEYQDLCFECWDVMTSEVNALRADVDNGGSEQW